MQYPYVAEEIFTHKQVEDNGDIVDIRIFRVSKSEQNPEGLSYSFVYIRDRKRLVGYDNFEGHQRIGLHHKHIKDRVLPYEFVDEWKIFEDFNADIEKIKRGIIK